IRLGVRFACAVARTLSSAHADGHEYNPDAPRHLRYESGGARPDGYSEPVCHAESYFAWTDAVGHRSWRQLATGFGQKARVMVTTGAGSENISRSHSGARDRVRGAAHAHLLGDRLASRLDREIRPQSPGTGGPSCRWRHSAVRRS